MSRNSLKIAVDPDWKPPFSLQYVDFASCEMGPRFPTWLQSQTEVAYLDISCAAISDNLPPWFGTTFSNAWKVNISQNGVNGTLPTNMEAMNSLERLYLNSNNLTGQLPRFPDALHILDISSNSLSGPLPANFGAPYMEDLRYYEESVVFNMVIIDLSSNFLAGEIPEEITSLDTVISLNFSRNRLSGKIPAKIGVMQALESLDLSENKLYGELPQSLSNLTYLSYLDLAYNNLTGTIPSGGQLDTLYAEYPFMYDGNSGLCGHPLPKNCSADNSGPKHGDGDQKGGQHDSKLVSFPSGLGVGFVVGLWIVFCVILFKKSWRIAYFQCFDKALDEVYVFLVTWGRWTKKTAKH